MKNTWRPEFLYLNSYTDKQKYYELLENKPYIHDTIQSQLEELIKVRNPSITPTQEQYASLIRKELKGVDLLEYGVWVYYPWSNRLVHLLSEDDFISVRTNRNKNKITDEEQNELKEKKVGIIGLSVGQSIALTLAMERTCGTLRLADFDDVELSNLNRIRTGVHHIGINKVVIAAREIAEIDPFIKIEAFCEGLNVSNMKDFMTSNGRLDMIVEVCDSLDIKIESRIEAKKNQIPVVMETNDRCMFDIERFDLEPNRPILHGLISDAEIENLSTLSKKEKMALILKIVDGDELSNRMKHSFGLLGHTLRAWPQLASSVTLGGGITTDIVRRLFLKEHIVSGRRYFDIDEVLSREVKYSLS